MGGITVLAVVGSVPRVDGSCSWYRKEMLSLSNSKCFQNFGFAMWFGLLA